MTPSRYDVLSIPTVILFAAASRGRRVIGAVRARTTSGALAEVLPAGERVRLAVAA